MRRPVNGVDVDPQAFAESLREIADAFEDRNASITEAVESHKADPEDTSKHTVEFTYVAEHGFENLFDVIEYTDPDEDNE